MDRRNARGHKNAIEYGPMETAVEKLGRNWDGQYSTLMICFAHSRFWSPFVFYALPIYSL